MFSRRYYYITKLGERAYLDDVLFRGNARDFRVLDAVISHTLEDDIVEYTRSASGRSYPRGKILDSLAALEEMGYIVSYM